MFEARFVQLVLVEVHAELEKGVEGEGCYQEKLEEVDWRGGVDEDDQA